MRAPLLLVAAIGSLAFAAQSSATLVRTKPVVIVADHAGGAATGTFRLGFASRLPARSLLVHVAEAGSTTRRVHLGVAHGRVRRVWGSESMRGARGTLHVRWTAVQHRANGRWGGASGTWSLTGGTGSYMALRGHGRVSAAHGLATLAFEGIVVTAV